MLECGCASTECQGMHEQEFNLTHVFELDNKSRKKHEDHDDEEVVTKTKLPLRDSYKFWFNNIIMGTVWERNNDWYFSIVGEDKSKPIRIEKTKSKAFTAAKMAFLKWNAEQEKE